MTALLKPDFSAATSALFVKSFNLPRKSFSPQHAHDTVFFGTGLVTQKAMSEGLPFDFLSMVVTAETLRRDLMNTQTAKIVHYIPDVTARQNAFAEDAKLEALADNMERTAGKLVRHFGLQDNYIVVRGKEIEGDNHRQTLLTCAQEYAETTDVPPQFKGYLAEQLADMALLSTKYRRSVKLSWTMARNPENAAKGLDESFFDTHYAAFAERFLFGNELDFAYIQPGRRLDAKVNRACPYTAIAGEPRLSLTKTFSLASLIEKSGLRPDGDVVKDAVRYWGHIVDEMEDLFDVKGLPQKPTPLKQKHTAEDVVQYRQATIERIDGARAKIGEILAL